MKVLIAGGAGFIGSHLADLLIRNGHTVVCADNFLHGIKGNVAHLLGNGSFTLVCTDLSDLDSTKSLFREEGFEFVFHLAANSDIQKSSANPGIDNQHTYSTTFNLLECMRLYDVKRLFFASTSAVYGEKHGEHVSETSTLEPISYYGAAKLGSEALISAYSYMNGFSALIFRFPNVIGSRLTHGVIYDFIDKLKKDPMRLKILGDGKQSKPYIHVSDLVNCIIRYMNTSNGVTVYNVGVDSQTTVDFIADTICDEMGLVGVHYDYTGGKGGWVGDVPIFSYDLSKIHATGWKAQHTSNEAVVLTVKEVLACKL